MTIMFSALTIAFAAFLIWLGVRIVNRRERWAKWTAAGLVLSLVAYPLSYGPFYWLLGRGWISQPVFETVSYLYAPLGWILDGRDPPEWYAAYLGWWFDRAVGL